MSSSFNLAGGAQTFVVDVHEVDAGIGIGDQSTLSVAGACGGSCAPPNQVPIAVATNVTVTANPLTLTAFASIDNGSSDPDGGPAGPDAVTSRTAPDWRDQRHPHRHRRDGRVEPGHRHGHRARSAGDFDQRRAP